MIDKHEKFKISLDKNRQIIFRIDGIEHKLTNRNASAIRYELYRILEIQEELRDLDWKLADIEKEIS